MFGGQCAASKTNIKKQAKSSVDRPSKDNVRKQVDTTTPSVENRPATLRLPQPKVLYASDSVDDDLLKEREARQKHMDEALTRNDKTVELILKSLEQMRHSIATMQPCLLRVLSVSTLTPQHNTAGSSTSASSTSTLQSTTSASMSNSTVNQQGATVHQASLGQQPASAATGSSAIPVSGNTVASTSSQLPVTSTTFGSTANTQIIRGWDNRIATPLYREQINGIDIVIGEKVDETDMTTVINIKRYKDALHYADNSSNFLVRLMSAVYKDEDLVGKRFYKYNNPLCWQEGKSLLSLTNHRFSALLCQVDKQFPGFIELSQKRGHEGYKIRIPVNHKCRRSEVKVRQLANAHAAQYNM